MIKIPKDHVTHLLSYLTAWADNKEVQVRWENDPNWHTVGQEFEFLEGMAIRIKPIPKLRPWKPEEVPVGAILRDNNVKFGEPAKVLIIAVRGAWVHFMNPQNAKLDEKLCDEFNPNWEHSLDHGKTWLPCGVKEESD